MRRFPKLFSQMHFKKTANIIFATCRLVTHFYCGHNMRRFVRMTEEFFFSSSIFLLKSTFNVVLQYIFNVVIPPNTVFTLNLT